MVIDPQMQAWAEELIESRAQFLVKEEGMKYSEALDFAEEEYIIAYGSIGINPN